MKTHLIGKMPVGKWESGGGGGAVLDSRKIGSLNLMIPVHS